MKEIHFYKDLVEVTLEDYFDLFHYTHNGTVKSINNDISRIDTTAISALDFSWLIDKGYKIYLHENSKVGEVYEGVTELTDKELRKGHDIRKIWIGGGFEDYFYGK